MLLSSPSLFLLPFLKLLHGSFSWLLGLQIESSTWEGSAYQSHDAHISGIFQLFFLNLSPMVPLPWVSLSSTGSNLIDREVTSQVTCVFWKIWHFCLFVPHICFSFFYSLQIWLNKWTKYALLCHIIDWKYCFYTSVVCFSSPYLKHLNKNYPVITSGSPMTPPKPLYLGKSPDRCCMCGQGNTSVHITNSALHYMIHWTSSKYFSWSFSCSPFYSAEIYHIFGDFLFTHFCLF